MSNWKVFLAPIELLPHENSDNLLIGKLDRFSIVVAKSNGYENGQIVAFAPKNSLLPDSIKNNYRNTDTGVSYLKGPEENRVMSIRLRNVESMGVTLNLDWVKETLGVTTLDEIPLYEDLSEKLGIKQYEIPIPVSLAGEVETIKDIQFLRHHDVEGYHLYKNEFIEGEHVFATSKLHGSMVTFIHKPTTVNTDGSMNYGNWMVSSKGISKKGLIIKESPDNFYWKAFYNSNIDNICSVMGLDGDEIQIFAEALPCQKNYNYGLTEPTIRIFRMIINGKELEWEELKALGANSMIRVTPNGKEPKGMLAHLLVPEVYSGPFDEAKLLELAKQKEDISKKQLHIGEGIVVRPRFNRRSKEGFNLFIKVINPSYREQGEEFS